MSAAVQNAAPMETENAPLQQKVVVDTAVKAQPNEASVKPTTDKTESTTDAEAKQDDSKAAAPAAPAPEPTSCTNGETKVDAPPPAESETAGKAEENTAVDKADEKADEKVDKPEADDGEGGDQGWRRQGRCDRHGD